MSTLTYEHSTVSAANEHYIELLNDLLCINNDRIEGYKKAIDSTDTHDQDLHDLFFNMISQSEGYSMELSALIESTGQDSATENSLGGRIYKAWVELKSLFNSNTRKGILEACERCEDATQKAYTESLKVVLPETAYITISKQQAELKSSHDKIRTLRDLQ